MWPPVAHGHCGDFRHIFCDQCMISDPTAGCQNARPCGDRAFAAGIFGGNRVGAVLVINIGDGGVLQHGDAVFLAQGDHPLHDIGAT